MVRHAVFTILGKEYIVADSPLKHTFNFTPAVSIFIDCDSDEEADVLFKKLSDNGQVMVPLDNYGFSNKFGWCADKYSVSWQINLPD